LNSEERNASWLVLYLYYNKTDACMYDLTNILLNNKDFILIPRNQSFNISCIKLNEANIKIFG